MHHISEAGCSTGEYVGDGRGDDETVAEQSAVDYPLELMQNIPLL